MRLENAGKLLSGLHPNTVRNRAVKGKLLQLSLTSSYKKTPGSQAGLSGSSVDQWQERRKGGRAGETAMLASVRGERGTGRPSGPALGELKPSAEAAPSRGAFGWNAL